jgi:D-3-phosphoglycerate dehydrogenase
MKKKIILILNNKFFEKPRSKKFDLRFAIIKKNISSNYELKKFLENLAFKKIYIDIIFCSLGLYFDKNILSSQIQHLKLLVTPTTGLDHINYKELQNLNLKIVSLNEYPTFLKTISSTAEHTWAIILALSRKLVLGSNDVIIQKNWRRDYFLGKQLADKKLCIVGFGRLGKKIAHYGKAFGMNVFAFDIDKSKFTKKFSYVNYLSIKKILKIADVLTIHVPLIDKNINFITNQNLKKLKKDAILVNTSRGNLFSEEFALNLLKKKKFFGLGLDVFKFDSIWNTKKKINISFKKFRKCNLVITPHLGGNTVEARIKTMNFLLEKLLTMSIIK